MLRSGSCRAQGERGGQDDGQAVGQVLDTRRKGWSTPGTVGRGSLLKSLQTKGREARGGAPGQVSREEAKDGAAHTPRAPVMKPHVSSSIVIAKAETSHLARSGVKKGHLL